MRSIENTPKNIQPYYRAWMFANPEQPRAWEKDKWQSNWHFSTWIQKMHSKYKTEVLGINPNDYFEKDRPYSDEERANFEIWLFELLGINKDTIIL